MSEPGDNAVVDARATQRVELLIDAGRYGEALVHARALVTDRTDDPEMWHLVARSHLGLGEPRQALDAADRAVACAPDVAFSHELRARALTHLRRYDEALAAARAGLQVEPWDPGLRIALVNAAVDGDRRLEEAEWAASEAVRLAPGEPLAHVAVGDVATARESFSAAERAYLEALRLDPGNAVAQHQLALVRMGQGRLVEAADGLATSGAGLTDTGVVAHNVRLVVLVWLHRTHVGAWLVWFVARAGARTSPSAPDLEPATAVVTVLGIAVLVWWTRHTIGRLRDPVRLVLWRVLRSSPGLSGWALAVGCGALATMVGAFVPSADVRGAALTAAGVALLVGVLLGWGAWLMQRWRARNRSWRG